MRKRKFGKLLPQSQEFQRSELVGPRSKVRLFDEGYTPRGRDSSYFGYFHPNGLNDCLVCK